MEPIPNGGLKAAIQTFFETNKGIVSQKILVKPGPDQEDAVHDMRVAVKKIRTVFRLIEYLAPGRFHQKQQMAKLRVLFRSAGLLRELEVSLGVNESYEQLQTAFYRRVAQLLYREKQSAQPLYELERKAYREQSVIRAGKLLSEILSEMPESLLVEKTEALYRHRLDQMLAVMPATYDPELIHKARIHLKEAMYLMGLLQQGGYADRLPAGILEAAKAAAEVAGDWHDREVFYQWMQIQLRPAAPLHHTAHGYRLLFQDLHVHTRNQVAAFRRALKTLEKLRESATSQVPAMSLN